jgi:hypothetical protein
MDIYKVLNAFKWLGDTYMLDYFIEDQWSGIPTSWRIYFDALLDGATNDDVISIIEFLLDRSYSKEWPRCKVVPPLSLIALRAFIRFNSLPQFHPVTDPSELANLLDVTARFSFSNYKAFFRYKMFLASLEPLKALIIR